jgi:hypothetical protein
LARVLYKLPKRGLLARSLRKVCIKNLIEIYAQDLLDYENGHRATARPGQLESQLIPRVFRSGDGSCLWVLDWSMLFALKHGKGWLPRVDHDESQRPQHQKQTRFLSKLHVQFKIFVPSLNVL